VGIKVIRRSFIPPRVSPFLVLDMLSPFLCGGFAQARLQAHDAVWGCFVHWLGLLGLLGGIP